MTQPAAVLVSALALAALPVSAAPPRDVSFQFGVIGHTFQGSADETVLRRALSDANAANPAFLVATGIKGSTEPCSDKLYAQRRAMLDDSDKPLVLSLAGSDWSACLNSAGRSNAIERLNRLRELYFFDGESLGARKLAVTRLSSTAKFRSYAENAHWEVGKVLFATINLPANNNHYRPEAGRNSEYEDRLVANRAWLQRLFTLARRKQLEAVVLFSDGAVGLPQDDSWFALPSFQSKQDGFAAPRKQIKAMAEDFKGKVLLIDTQGGSAAEASINWRANIGHLSLGADWVQIRVAPGTATLFQLKGGSPEPVPQQ
ncbi:MAG: hypothetical protein ACEQSK_16515 [Sphingomonadaceae bacterium]